MEGVNVYVQKKDFNPKDAVDLDTLLDGFEVGVKILCNVCGKAHYTDEDSFFVLWGNLTAGFNGGLIGPNFDKDGKLARLFIFCRTPECVLRAITKYTIKGGRLEQTVKPVENSASNSKEKGE